MSGRPDGGGPAVDAAGDFGGFDGRAWLNCAHQGPLPLVAVAAAERALADKAAPHRMGDEAFAEVPRRLKDVLGRLVGVPAEEVILGNSTTYGLQLLVQGVDWRAGDEVLLVDGDFPATIVPWLPLAERGVRVRLLRPEGGVLDAGQLEAELTPATRLFCTSWVFSFTGHAVDLAALGRVCRRAGVTFVVNGSQAVGARPLDLAELPVDALVSCGFKWLCGPYGTGFCWLAPDLLASLTYRPAYWLGHLGQDDLGPGGRLPAARRRRRRRLRRVRHGQLPHLPALDGLGRVPARASASTGSPPGTRRWSSGSSRASTPTATGWPVPARAPGAPPWSCSATTGPSGPRSCTGAWRRPGSTWPSGAGGCGCPRTCTTPRPTSTAPWRCSTVTPPR